MRIGVVHTLDSPCVCHRFILSAMSDLGHDTFEVASEEIALHLDGLAACHAVFEHADTYLLRTSMRSYPRLLMESHGVQLVGASARACALADDKIRTKRLFQGLGLPTPAWSVLRQPGPPAGLTYPCVLKPAFEHCSRGLSLASNPGELAELAREFLSRYREPLVVEEFIPGRELALSILGNDAPLCLPIFEVRPLIGPSGGQPSLYTYQAKFDPASSEAWSCPRPAQMPVEMERSICSAALEAYRAIGLRDYARFDLRLHPDGRYFFLEANAKPSVEAGSFLPMAAAEMGWSLKELLEQILTCALERAASPSVQT
ncbi:MAG: hypothetical protein HYU36_10195 [Planctomycetes bacterium]|nr:hypothetical protein [Planctomycetota bacterium]